MIEIKKGWSGREAIDQQDVRELQWEIKKYTQFLADAQEKLLSIQSKCEHKHVLFEGQQMTCEVCKKELEK
ncbi:hypothetical protein [Acinetobacter sp.]|uniref:hypothetical protein n=1 Tax=Acinetobacter sp. TaxID=472 RepID=UPI0038908CC8